MTNPNLYYSFLIVGCIFLIGCSDDLLNHYNPQEIILEREEKIILFHNSDDSPLTEADKQAKSSLDFFPPDSSYVVRAVLVPASVKDTISFPTTVDTIFKEMKFMGKMTFVLNDQNQKLDAFVSLKSLKRNPDGPHLLFLPFSDHTNGVTTYLGGRYLDVPLEEDFNYILDFNKAYSPYCAYNDGFSCPIVPDESHIHGDVNAGEKLFISTSKQGV